MEYVLKPVTKKENSVNNIAQTRSGSYWFIFYTFPRAEKVVYKELMKRDYNVFLPMKKTMRIWKNRQNKCIEQVLFPNYIFVRTQQNELYYITQIPKIVTYIQCAGKPSIISTEEIEVIKKMILLNQEISVEKNFYEGESVRIVNGPMVGYEGILIKQNCKTRFGIRLKEINHLVSIEIGTNVIEKV